LVIVTASPVRSISAKMRLSLFLASVLVTVFSTWGAYRHLG
jgi:hypothetical protein